MIEKYLDKTYIKKDIKDKIDGNFGRLWLPIERWYFTLELDRDGKKIIKRLSSGAGHNKFSFKQVENNIKRGKWVEVKITK